MATSLQNNEKSDWNIYICSIERYDDHSDRKLSRINLSCCDAMIRSYSKWTAADASFVFLILSFHSALQCSDSLLFPLLCFCVSLLLLLSRDKLQRLANCCCNRKEERNA